MAVDITIIVFKKLAENCKKQKQNRNIILHLSRAITLTRESSDNFDPSETFEGLIIRIISKIERIWLNLTGLEINEKNSSQTPLFSFK